MTHERMAAASMKSDIDRVLYHRRDIAARVEELGRAIARDLDGLEGHPSEIMLMPILTGSLVFVADLIRHLPQKLQIGVVSVSSYPGKSMESKGAALRSEIPENLEGRHVVIVDDILDSGGTIQLVQSIIEERRPESVRTCVLLRKKRESAMKVRVDYVGFDIPDEFVVGYGLDYDDYYRNLPDIVTLRAEAL
ncbi:MAG: hypoxanthine phosphoribosyltransferase [Phycisphaerales bacterium]